MQYVLLKQHYYTFYMTYNTKTIKLNIKTVINMKHRIFSVLTLKILKLN